jgi:hypothetical protein
MSQQRVGTWMVLLVVLIAAALTYSPLFKCKGEFSEHQTVAHMYAEYAKCKANAPAGFDCYMQPVLVSEGFIIQEVQK